MSNDKSSEKETTPDFFLGIFRGLGKVMNLVGIVGFAVLALVIGIFYFSDASQKKEIIDVWILFKGSNNPFILVVLILIIIVVSQQIHYKGTLKMKQDRIDELANKKNSNYRNKLGDSLSSSNKTKKP